MMDVDDVQASAQENVMDSDIDDSVPGQAGSASLEGRLPPPQPLFAYPMPQAKGSATDQRESTSVVLRFVAFVARQVRDDSGFRRWGTLLVLFASVVTIVVGPILAFFRWSTSDDPVDRVPVVEGRLVHDSAVASQLAGSIKLDGFVELHLSTDADEANVEASEEFLGADSVSVVSDCDVRPDADVLERFDWMEIAEHCAITTLRFAPDPQGFSDGWTFRHGEYFVHGTFVVEGTWFGFGILEVTLRRLAPETAVGLHDG